jgi:ATP/maltotriose-dependent transcriptional regulator MalT
MKLNDNEILVGQHVIEIGEQEMFFGTNEWPDYLDLTLTIDDGEHEIVITGMDDEMEGFAKAILAALKAKQDRQAAEKEEDERLDQE